MRMGYVKAAIASALAVMIIGCKKETNVADNGSLRVRAAVTATKSETSAFSSSTIGVYVDDEDGIYSPTANSIATVSSGSNGVATTPAIYINAPATVYAYYPGNANEITNPSSASAKGISVAASDDFSAAGQTDYMWASPVNVTKSNRMVALTFNHALAKLVFSISLGTDYAGTGTLTAIKLSSTSETGEFLTGTAGSMSIKDGSITGLSATKELDYAGSKSLSTTSTDIIELVAPAKLAASTAATSTITITVTIDGSDYSKILPVSTVSAWAGGSSYTYSITVGSGSLSMGSVSINNWGEGGTTAVTVE